MVGGKFQIGPATPTTWAIGYVAKVRYYLTLLP
jgi:hypothetical protein